MDTNFNGNSIQLLEETIVSDVTVGLVGVDDLLVVASDPALVLLYPKEQITSFLKPLAEHHVEDVDEAGSSVGAGTRLEPLDPELAGRREPNVRQNREPVREAALLCDLLGRGLASPRPVNHP